MTETLRTIVEVLSEPNSFRWSDALYADPDNLADLNSPCLVLDPDSVDTDEDEEPAEAKARGFSYILAIQDIQSIHANLTAQVGTVQLDQLLEAFRHYFERDAFMVLDRNTIGN
ncbi:MAG: hypothetical protein MK180_09070 [Rhodobacteraceae bacterium]|nr:hypothetical protein [Paracoccaceae bacterium]